MTTHWLTDPYPNRPDRAAWEELFRVEFPVSGGDPAGLYGTARGLRCEGVSLRPNRAGGYRLAPPVDMDHDELEELAGAHFAALQQLVGSLP